MTGSHSKSHKHGVTALYSMHRYHRNDGEWVPSTQHSVDESKQQQRGAHGGFVHAYRSPRSRTPVAPPSPRTLCKRTCGHIAPDTHKHTKVGGEFGAATATRKDSKSYTRHNSDASL
ncbi:hypothetical protein TcCL_ESM07761 [Trypanosoma cruzi]|nr:hypothetical protein TcCL_ESM07761 [Trypanosoma cruzi]